MPSRFRLFGGDGPATIDRTTPAAGEATILGIPYRVAIWTESQWAAIPEAVRPGGTTSAGPFRVLLEPRSRADASGRV